MSTLAWATQRFLPHRGERTRTGFVWWAIAASAVLFGAGHLPAASAVLGSLNASIVAFVIIGNSVFGLLFGYLFWRCGLESAMIAHALAHTVSYLARLS
jgi:membrane protease YdiL (CAAX protease family)